MKDFWQAVTNGFLCDCGKRHSFEAKVYDEDALSALVKVMPEGTHALLISDDENLRKRLNRIYRITTLSSIAAQSGANGGQACKDAATGAATGAVNDGVGGGAVSPCSADYFDKQGKSRDGGDAAVIQSRGRTRKVRKLEDIRLVIAEGKGVPQAKYIAEQISAKLAVLGAADYSPFAFIQRSGFTVLHSGAQPHIILGTEPSEDVLANCFAFCALTALSLFEWEFASGAGTCPVVYIEAFKAVAALVRTVKRRTRQSAVVKEAVLDCCLRLGVLSGALGQARLSVNGAVQTAAALRRLFFVENCGDAGSFADLGGGDAGAVSESEGTMNCLAGSGAGGLSSGERETADFTGSALVLSPIVARSYAAFLSRPIGYSPPPDNIMRADRLNNFFGVRETRAIRKLAAYRSRADEERAEHMLNLNRKSLLRRIETVIRLLDEAVLLYFKLLPDGGYRFKNYADSLDISLSLGLGADILPFDTMLKAMRDKGVLDNLVL